ncbi:MAG: alkaline phosphatase [bacterium]|nr:alkaline phosphatase [bacterium]
MFNRRLLACLCLTAAPLLAETTITHGPILGRLSTEGVGVWARTNTPGTFRVIYGTAPDRLDQVSTEVETTLAHDNTGWVHITGLKPNTRYWYRAVTADHGNTAGGGFRTLPRAADYRHAELNPKGLFNFRFEFACGNNQIPWQGAGHDAPAFKTMLERLKDKIYFSIQNGDWLYEEQRMYQPAQWLAQVGAKPEAMPRVLKVAPTLAGVWENYKLYLQRGANLAAYHRNMPHFFTFDDHEILNDVWGAGTPGLRDRRAAFRDIGVQAWYDYLGWANPTEFTQPIWFSEAQLTAGSDELLDPAADFTKLDLQQAGTLLVHWGEETAGVNENALDGVGGIANAGVYGITEVLGKNRLKITPAPKESGKAAYSIGRRSYYKVRIGNAEIFFTDTRTHRQMHDTRQPDKPGLSMLGLQQRKWLLDGMRASDADFLFVVSSVNFMVPHVGGGKVRAENKDDAWTVFLDEREHLIRTWDGLGKPVFVLTGDLHNSFVIKITDRVWEFASGPHNSQNHWYTDEGNRPPNGRFQYGPRACDIRWSTFYRDDVPREQLQHPVYTVVQVNNVFNNPKTLRGERWVAFPRPHVVVQYYDGRSGDLLYAETVQR